MPVSAKPGDDRPRALRPLDRTTLDQFIAVEEPSGGIDGQYARVLSTLKLPQFGEELREIEGGVQEGDFVVPRKTYLLANGSRLRWLGSMDLAELRQFAQFSISRRSLLEKLGHILPPGTDVERLINWCIQHEILGETDKVNLPTTQQDRLPSRSSGGV